MQASRRATCRIECAQEKLRTRRSVAPFIDNVRAVRGDGEVARLGVNGQRPWTWRRREGKTREPNRARTHGEPDTCAGHSTARDQGGKRHE